MFKQFFQSGSWEDQKPANGVSRTTAAPPPAPAEPSPEAEPRTATSAAPKTSSLENGKYSSFAEIYRSGAVKLPELSYNILKVADMIGSAHLAAMSPEAKRCALLMALEAAGVEVEALLQDAMLRQRALNDYEEEQRKRLKDYEAGKAAENGHIQAELDRLTADYMRRIQANIDDVARRQDEFDAWWKRKQQEAQRIVEAAALCVPQNTGSGNSLTSVLERAAVPATPRR
ncbi:MAG TPA: hypothetical protein VFA33_24600 [Bryobacteraceae bacterium]|nr:hypothetical protein [Bryobacteraceae bacterium]